MLRVRRVAAALRRLRKPLAPRPAQAAVGGLSSTGTQRIQQLRVFVYSAMQVTAAVQHFQGLTTTSPQWNALENGLLRSVDNNPNNFNTATSIINTTAATTGTIASAIIADDVLDHPAGTTAACTLARDRDSDRDDDGNTSVDNLTGRNRTNTEIKGTICTNIEIRTTDSEIKISDLQQLLHMHRAYVANAAADCLTFCGRGAVQQAAETALIAALDVASKVEHAIEVGRTAAGVMSKEGSWMRELEKNTTWEPIYAKIEEFHAAAGNLRIALGRVGSSGPLSGLASVLRAMS